MKAKVIDKDYYTPDFEVGEVVEIMKGMETNTADIWNAPIGKAWLCKKQDGTFRYNIPLNLQIIEAEEEHWQNVRERAAIAAMQGTITILGSSDRYAFRDVVVEGYRGNEKTYPKEIAQFAIACADALIEELKKK
jgi:hypothetical protein